MRSTVEATTPVIANGVDMSMVTVTLLDANGDPLGDRGAGHSVTLDFAVVGGGIPTVDDQNVVEDPSNPGTYTATLANDNTTIQTVRVTALLDGDALTQTADVVFAPVLEFADDQDDLAFTVGTPVNQTLPAAVGGAGGTISYALTGDLPAGLVFDRATRVLSGTPTAATATGTFTLTATEAGPPAQTATLGFDITVGAAPAVTTTFTGPDTVAEDEAATYTVTLGGSPSADVEVTWTVDHGGTGVGAVERHFTCSQQVQHFADIP